MRNHYTDQRLAELLAHARDGKLNYSSCCCFIGCATADHALQTLDRCQLTSSTGNDHLLKARTLIGAPNAEIEFLSWGLNHGPDNKTRNAYRSRILIPMIRAEMRRRERVRQQSEWKQELVEKGAAVFICGICKKSSKAGEKARMLVIERREIVHPRISNAHHYQNQEGVWKVKDDPGGVGTAIVKEILVCEKH